MFNQTLQATIGSTPNSIMDRQPVSTLDTNGNQGQSLPPQKDSYDVDPFDQIGNDPIKSLKKNRQVIMGIDALSHPTLNYIMKSSRSGIIMTYASTTILIKHTYLSNPII